MFIIDLIFSKKSDHVALEAELVCPDVAQADAAEDSLFYSEKVPNLLLVRLSPTTIRVSSLDFDPEWNWFFKKMLEDTVSAEESIRAHAPSFAHFAFLHLQRAAVQATIRCDVATYAELDLVENAA